MNNASSERVVGVCAALSLCGALALGPALAEAAGPSWSVGKLPGCEDLPARMARYYKPVEAAVTPAAPQYSLTDFFSFSAKQAALQIISASSER